MKGCEWFVEVCSGFLLLKHGYWIYRRFSEGEFQFSVMEVMTVHSVCRLMELLGWLCDGEIGLEVSSGSVRDWLLSIGKILLKWWLVEDLIRGFQIRLGGYSMRLEGVAND